MLHKQAFGWGATGLDMTIHSQLQGDPTLTVAQRTEIMNAVRRMDLSSKTDMVRVLSSMVGAGIGAAAMRFLAKAGLIGTLFGAAAGALVGSRLGRSTPNNLQRQGGAWVDNQFDMFGRPF